MYLNIKEYYLTLLQGGPVKTSLVKHLNIDSDDEEVGESEDRGGGVTGQATNGKPGRLKVDTCTACYVDENTFIYYFISVIL